MEPAVRRTGSWFLIGVGILMHSLLVCTVSSQSQEGFISIDCGGAATTDSVTSLIWEDDSRHLQAAEALASEKVAIKANVHLGASTSPVDNADRLKTAMVFYPGNPGRVGRSKYCYNLPITDYNSSGDSKNYLLRVTFPSRNLTTTAVDHDEKPISLTSSSARFYLTVDSTYIMTVDLHPFEPQIVELIITAFDYEVYVCLVPLEDRSSMPAISALELRPCFQGMYSRSLQSTSATNGRMLITTYMMTVARLNFGGDTSLPSLRFPIDRVDRLWSSPHNPSSRVSTVLAVNGSRNSFWELDTNIMTPDEVLKTAWIANSTEDDVLFTVNLTRARALRPVPTFYVYLIFYDVMDQQTPSWSIDIFLQQSQITGIFYGDAGISPQYWMHIYNRRRYFTGDVLDFTIRANTSSVYPGVISAAEFLGEFEAVTKRTDPEDADTIASFSKTFSSSLDTAGDPCLPVPWAWVICSIELPPRVTQINLTSKGVGGDLPTEFGALDRLTILDLSNNTFTGGVPTSLKNVGTLRAVNLGRNSLSGDLPTFDEGSFQNLESLSLSYNKLSGNLSSLIRSFDGTLFDLNLSNNNFSGSIPDEINQLVNLQYLDLSNNYLSGFINLDVKALKSLQTLNLSYNRLEGAVPDSIWNASSLQVVDLTGNSFTELNLTTWYESVIRSKRFDAIGVQVRLVGNQIRNVIPQNFETVENMASSLGPTRPFVLLGDNPWCNDRQAEIASLIARYLCRSNENDEFMPTTKDDSSRTLIIVGVVSGVVTLFMCCLLAYFLWRTWRRTRELHQIQEALAKEHVKPPFFNYEELKTATNNFSSENILGKGGYGTVYKVTLMNWSCKILWELCGCFGISFLLNISIPLPNSTVPSSIMQHQFYSSASESGVLISFQEEYDLPG
ncbi:hypothetical protein Mapa_004439 [Marchantia paleacea]|nr:hypothetical protein Mapa_004439 [Marchantia paleacea]